MTVGCAACAHGEPFRIAEQPPRGPFDADYPRRLTFNQGQDLAPSWLPDGSAIVYSLERVDRPDRDRCLGFLPAEGGSLPRIVCNRRFVADDSTDAYEEPAAGPNGLIAYQRSSATIGFLSYRFRALVVAPLDSPAGARGRPLLSLPYRIGGGSFHYGLSHIRWLSDSGLVYLGDLVGYDKRRQDQPIDTIVSGLKIMRVTLAGDSAVYEPLAGTEYATSVAAGPGGDDIYYTVGGDSRVFRRVLTSGATTVVWDFAPLGTARDVTVAGGRLAAVVGGDVTFAFELGFGDYAQRDAGGFLHVVDLGTGAETVLDGRGLMFRHPALSPDGTRIVAEAYAGREADLWLLEVP
jgi:hypothetical protein